MTNAESSKRWRTRHPEKAKEATRRWRENNVEKKKEINKKWVRNNRSRGHVAFRKWLYGLSEEQFESMKVDQNNRCAICFDVFIKTPCVDHDHSTKKNRGLLCRFCNLVLGNAHDRILVLEQAIEYLKKHGDSDGRTN
jgi:hypothetical protein